MPYTRSGASYSLSRSSQKDYRHDYGRLQSVTKGQGSVNEGKTEKVCHYEADNIVLPLNRADTPPQGASLDIYKARKKAYNNVFQQKEYQRLSDL
ncbi:hypothetical protein O181_084063 [Austropuccinia psidii MF-1]|uniref:Uncharacterized protein n=1 Tax=Austropuccinia psidii MF-1 TaxID=1389203 RepID=A0A9Q3FUW2_9BASI|nr:hypothetical protein [Austropuccinia psidii MF-1]